MITLIGSEGSMGKRYQAILRFKNTEFECFDKESLMGNILASARRARGVILATPTNTHGTYLRELIPVNKMILCEKPIVKDVDELAGLYGWAHAKGCELSMMLQYQELVDSNSEGESGYDYFRTGPDGLPWDAMQVIGFAKGPCVIDNKSPLWRGFINGRMLNISDMDYAYVRFVSKWLFGQIKQDPEMILQMTKKTRDFGQDAYESTY